MTLPLFFLLATGGEFTYFVEAEKNYAVKHFPAIYHLRKCGSYVIIDGRAKKVAPQQC